MSGIEYIQPSIRVYTWEVPADTFTQLLAVPYDLPLPIGNYQPLLLTLELVNEFSGSYQFKTMELIDDNNSRYLLCDVAAFNSGQCATLTTYPKSYKVLPAPSQLQLIADSDSPAGMDGTVICTLIY